LINKSKREEDYEFFDNIIMEQPQIIENESIMCNIKSPTINIKKIPIRKKK
jgi:hypothetical protein